MKTGPSTSDSSLWLLQDEGTNFLKKVKLFALISKNMTSITTIDTLWQLFLKTSTLTGFKIIK